MPIIIAFVAGLLMSAGIAYSQMIVPEKVLGFLTLNANWDPSLILVMASALAVYSTGYWLFAKKDKPLFAGQFHLPGKKELDKPLLLGSLLFGAGWGLVGYCPGPALAAISSGSSGTLAFIACMLLGWFISRKLPI
ncbi:MAG: YeeE/YedE family protein [Gammaproteobacteria bacterium]|nr:YeeE/YedE family protein [Gammaproteobacteria bacterium]MBU1557069.1 YeeE/YedE family protein [Gammaproteobacteria bacterium]MBU2069386.1 YeeE/YedE family protein [Gammaproteobacteria bacterium]MBU2184677.1 YeeE/YedE family protein [Gammaproteobacteria bacterium]MBU2206530.1 YeeE/YedE family protein [Gammaproteobacteria bacterium]